MRDMTRLVLSLLLLWTAALPAQELSNDEFLKTWKQGMDLEDEKIMDRAVKRGARHVILYFEALSFQARNGTDDAAELQCELLTAAWKRVFPDMSTLEKVGRWTDGATDKLYTKLQTCLLYTSPSPRD